MNNKTALLNDISSAVERQSDEQREDTVVRIADLFVHAAGKFDPQHVQLFDDVLMRMIQKIETRALIALGERFAGVPNAPAGVINFLARLDEMAVAGPVLTRSTRLNQNDLVDIATTKGQPHLLAISQRESIEKPVTDVLIRRGNDDVLRHVAANSGAQLSETGYGQILERAHKDDAIAIGLAARPDIPQHILHALLLRATDEVRGKLVATVPPEIKPEIQRMLDRIAEDIVLDADDSDYTAVKKRILAACADGKLSEARLQEYAQAKQREESIVGLAVLCNVPPPFVEKVLEEERVQPLLMLCKAADISWSTTRALVPFRRRVRETSVNALTEICGAYSKMKPDSARAALEFWRSRAIK